LQRGFRPPGFSKPRDHAPFRLPLRRKHPNSPTVSIITALFRRCDFLERVFLRCHRDYPLETQRVRLQHPILQRGGSPRDISRAVNWLGERFWAPWRRYEAVHSFLPKSERALYHRGKDPVPSGYVAARCFSVKDVEALFRPNTSPNATDDNLAGPGVLDELESTRASSPPVRERTSSGERPSTLYFFPRGPAGHGAHKRAAAARSRTCRLGLPSVPPARCFDARFGPLAPGDRRRGQAFVNPSGVPPFWEHERGPPERSTARFRSPHPRSDVSALSVVDEYHRPSRSFRRSRRALTRSASTQLRVEVVRGCVPSKKSRGRPHDGAPDSRPAPWHLPRPTARSLGVRAGVRSARSSGRPPLPFRVWRARSRSRPGGTAAETSMFLLRRTSGSSENS